MRILVGLMMMWAWPALASSWHDGDVVFQTSRSAQSVAIQQATRSPYSHVGVVVLRHGQPFVLEAVATVRLTPLQVWTARGQGGRFVVKRLLRAEQWTPEAVAKLRAYARQQTGKPYDLTFGWSDERMYCSELVWKLYRHALGLELSRPQRLADFHLDAPAVQAKLRERYGQRPPLDEPVVSPAAVFESPLLITVTP